MNNLNELRTMEEKKKLDPKEIMENGLTREQNEKIQKNADEFGGLLSLVSLGLTFYALYLVFSI